MTRPTPPKAAIGAAEAITRPIFIVSLGSHRFCSREDVVFGGFLYVSTGMKYAGNQLSIYNEDGRFTDSFMDSRGIIYVTIRMSYGESPFVDSDWYIDFFGEVGRRDFTEWIVCELKPFSARAQPVHSVTRPIFNHLPARGTKIVTPTGIYVLEPF